MGRIVAIAGGDLSSTRELNMHSVKLAGKDKPNVLFVGTASHDDEEYIEEIAKAFELLNCEVKALCLCSRKFDPDETDCLLAWADIIYVGGGDTVSMMQIWKQYGLDIRLKRIYEEDLAVLTGLSAGSSCWFTCGHSDSESFHSDGDWSFCWANGLLDIIHFAYCPHYDEEGRNSFDEMLAEKNMPGLAMENNTALVENRGKLYYIRSAPDANAYRIQYTNGVMDKQALEFEAV